MKLKAPPKPPPSVSPSTNLRLHRQNMQSLVDSPFRRLDALLPAADNAVQQTPGFDADGLWYDLQQAGGPNSAGFDIFEDAADFGSIFALTPAAVSTGSPAKRSVRKQRLERSQSTGALGHIAANSAQQHSASKSVSFLKVPSTHQTPSMALETPSKVFDGLPSSPSKLFLDLQSPCKAGGAGGMSLGLLNDENSFGGAFAGASALVDGLNTPDFLDENDFSGFDMLAGFEKIGSNNSAAVVKPATQQGPLGRSYSTAF
jgi:hypothetical protein